jgi:hypothetical protein
VSFGFNESKAYVVTKVNLDAFANGAFIWTNLFTLRIDLVDITTLIEFHTLGLILLTSMLMKELKKDLKLRRRNKRLNGN